MIRAANFCQLIPICAYFGPQCCVVFNRIEKVQKTPKHDFFDILECIGCVRGKTHFVIRAANFCQLIPICAYFGPKCCDVINRNEKVQKAPKQDFLTYWSVLGAFVGKTHFVIRAANFCQLMPILAHEGAMFSTGIKKFKKSQNMIFGH